MGSGTKKEIEDLTSGPNDEDLTDFLRQRLLIAKRGFGYIVKLVCLIVNLSDEFS
jgi:hypothetical protein